MIVPFLGLCALVLRWLMTTIKTTTFAKCFFWTVPPLFSVEDPRLFENFFFRSYKNSCQLLLAKSFWSLSSFPFLELLQSYFLGEFTVFFFSSKAFIFVSTMASITKIFSSSFVEDLNFSVSYSILNLLFSYNISWVTVKNIFEEDDVLDWLICPKKLMRSLLAVSPRVFNGNSCCWTYKFTLFMS